jgi:hypothetical protein
VKGRKNQVYWLILVKIHAPGPGSAFPIRIRIQDSQIYADPSGSGSTTLVPSKSVYHGKFFSRKTNIHNYKENMKNRVSFAQ